MTKGLLQVKACILHSLQHQINQNNNSILHLQEKKPKNYMHFVEFHKKECQKLELAYHKVLIDDWSFDDINYDGDVLLGGATFTISQPHIEAANAEYRMLTLDLKIKDVLSETPSA